MSASHPANKLEVVVARAGASQFLATSFERGPSRSDVSD
jgi:hypothetical protein